MSQLLLTIIPTTRAEAGKFLSDFACATALQIQQVERMVNALPAESLATLADVVIPLCYDERFLSMAYESREVGKKITQATFHALFVDALSKTRNLMLTAEVGDQLAAGLIENFANEARTSFLSQLARALRGNGNSSEFLLGGKFDDAMAKHVRNAPCSDLEQIWKSWVGLKDAELPKTLEVFVTQLMADGRFPNVEHSVVDLFQTGTLHDSYIPVFRRILGDDVFSKLCADANHFNGGSFHTAAKIIPWAGEDAFHTPAFLADFKVILSSLNQARITYLDDFLMSGADGDRFPILAGFVLKNMKSIMRQPQELSGQKFILPVVSLAVRNGQGKAALKHMVNGMMRRTISSYTDGVLDANLSDIVSILGRDAQSDLPRTQTVQHWNLLLKATEMIGLETAKQVIPDADPVFIQSFLANKKTDLSKGAVLKLFPQAKRDVLEHDLGL